MPRTIDIAMPAELAREILNTFCNDYMEARQVSQDGYTEGFKATWENIAWRWRRFRQFAKLVNCHVKFHQDYGVLWGFNDTTCHKCFGTLYEDAEGTTCCECTGRHVQWERNS